MSKTLAGRRLDEEKGASAESASAAKSRFLAMVSHEMRTPLNGILGITQLLAGTRLTAEQQSYVEAVRHSGNALLTLIEDLLDFSSMEAGKFQLRPEPGDIRALVGGVVELSAARADEKNIEIAAYIGPEVPATVFADHGRLRQVLFNLVGNALKFTEEGGVFVEVRAEAVGTILFKVRDSGPGLNTADQARIFEEFERADNDATRRNGGAGLGLAISARLIAAMGGTIGVESAPSQGSTFTFTIPHSAAAGEPVRNVPASLAGSRVLLVSPPGPTEEVLLRIIRDHGGAAASASDLTSARKAVAGLTAGGQPLTDVVVDNRLAAAATALFAAVEFPQAADFRRTMMVTPAQRAVLTAGAKDFSAWLIRPLRVASLVKVLTRETGDLGTWLEERETTPEVARRLPGRIGKLERPLTILLAEDNPVNALLVRSALQRAGHAVVHVPDGQALVERISGGAHGRVDVVLTDLSMPLLDGIGAVRAIRGFERERALSPLPIIVLSAEGQERSRAEAIESGASDYLEKPVDPALLLQAVEGVAALARPGD